MPGNNFSRVWYWIVFHKTCLTPVALGESRVLWGSELSDRIYTIYFKFCLFKSQQYKVHNNEVANIETSKGAITRGYLAVQDTSAAGDHSAMDNIICSAAKAG